MSRSRARRGTSRETSAYRGVPPMAAISLTLTASARQPTSAGVLRPNRKWTPSTCASHVASARPGNDSTAVSSPTPVVTPGPTVGTKRLNLSINANSPSPPIGRLRSAEERGIDVLPQPPGRLDHVVGEGDRRNHRDPDGAGADHGRRVLDRDAADADDRQRGRPTDLLDAAKPHGRPRVGLRRRRVDRTHAEVVRAGPPGLVRLFAGRRRDAEQRAAPEHCPGRRRREIVLSDVHAVGPGGDGDVHAVVHDERDPGGTTDRGESARRLHHRAGRFVLHPQLQRGGAAAHGGLANVEVGPPPCPRGIGDDVDPPVAAHRHARILAARVTAAPSSAASASSSRTRNVPGPGDASAARSAATSKQVSPAAAAFSVSGSTAQNAPTTAVAMQPLPVICASKACPFSIRTVRRPSVSRSTRPVAATTAPVARASARARSSSASTRPAASTPRTPPGRPANAATSPAFPRTQATRTASSRRRDCAVRNAVAPAPTGSSTTGTPAAFARRPANSITSTTWAVSVPMLSTRAPAAATISSTSSAACAITGDAPTARVTLATSFTVTTFVM